ncbi:MAG TPA: PAS domain-containing sensor histidine kinase, partial [Devosia sp.]|nr:PAS domain-containing sensor histidine kinase [Devosia sp.]
LFSFGASKEMSLAIAGSGHRPEMLRRKTLATNARLVIAASAILMLPAIICLVLGTALPFIIAAIGLASGMIALALHQRGQFEQAAAAQVYAILGIGLILTLADRQLADAGLAIAVLGPVHASLLARNGLRRQSWALLAGVGALAVLSASFPLSAIPATGPELIAICGMAFLICAGIVAHSANRIGAAYEVYDKAQVTAYRHLIEHVQDAVLRFSSDGEVLLASQTSEALFGCRRYELTGSGLGERLHVADRPAYLTAFADANQGGKTRIIEVRMRQDDPTTSVRVPRFIWVEISLSPVIDVEQSEVRHEVVALFRDVTARKDTEAAMSEARRVAEDASTAKSRFLATIGHELRTPLNAVVGFSEMMTTGIGGELSPTHKEYAGLIHQSGKHLLEVVRMLLDMSKIEAGKFEVQTEPFAPDSLVETCFKMVEGLARERNIHLVANIAHALPQLTADERACRQILLNLLSNAIKFSNEGGTVTVTMKRQGQSLNISVADSGIGMAPESVQRVGEPFFQANEGLSRRYEGTGLGLSIVKGLVELHDGTLRAMSEIGAGTNMTVLLPRNGPAIKLEETATITPLHREQASPQAVSWQNEKRKAQ